MSVLHSPDSAEGKERLKWDRPRNQSVDGEPGMRCVGHEEYPKALYKAGRPTMANVELTSSLTARDASHERVLLGQGWQPTPQAAIDAVHMAHVEASKLAAERHHVERTMSPRAQAEAAAVDAETVQHVAAIPETPIRRRPGRPSRKAEVS